MTIKHLDNKVTDKCYFGTMSSEKPTPSSSMVPASLIIHRVAIKPDVTTDNLLSL